ncbi:bloated [Cochliomyia hominivorax]
MAVQNQRLPKDTKKTDTTSTDQAPAAQTITSPPTSTKTSASTSASVANSASNTSKPTKNQTSSTSATPAPQQQQQQQQSQVSSAQPNSNGGPRVSFNRDVHVKRIGKRSNDLTNYETTNLQPPQHTSPYHQLPADLSAESIQKEAALVLAQAKRHKSIAENGDNIPTFRVKTKRSGVDSNPKKFHSLPLRKKKSSPTKTVSRSNSDAAAKKPNKRPSIFNIFSRKSDSNLNQNVDRDPRFEDSGGRRLVRSKSDVGSSSYKLKKVLKESKPLPSTANNSASNRQQQPSQLSPIIENDSREDCFEEQFNRERRKSDAITDREKHESGLEELLARSQSQTELDGNIVRNPISDNIKEKILHLQAKSQENMHSSQLPAQKLPLTKGQTVNGMVKRLSMERFSPPPPIMGPAFSYIRPNEGITYAQLELQDDISPQRSTLTRRDYTQRVSPVREYRSPAREYRSASRDIFTPEREIVRNNQPRLSEDQNDFIASHSAHRNQYSPNYDPASGTTTIHIGGSFSPSPWQQLSPRNLSDEDEGLGLETRKYYEEDLQHKRSKSPAEPPIVPKIRSITPPPHENEYHANERYLSPARELPKERYLSPARELPNNDDMGYRRARLESRILTRKFGDSNTLERNGYLNSRENSHDRVLEDETDDPSSYHRRRYLSPEREIIRDPYEPRFHKPEANEILNKYSPERSHLDIIAPSLTQISTSTLPKTEKTSRYKHTKYYDDGTGHGIKEVYERETQFDMDGKPHVRESRHRERVDSFSGKPIREEASPLMERHNLTDYEPKSLDSQFTCTDQYRSSPENMKRYENLERGLAGRQSSEDRWHSSLKRDKLQQRSFDKGDSGIENDFRKESFNGDIVTRWRKRTIADDIKSCENFLKKERRHCEHQRSAGKRKENYVYRERSIDDGSHYDPHLDKYPDTSSKNTTLRRRDQQSQTAQTRSEDTATLKRNKKLGGFEKVKQLFGAGSGTHDKKDVERKSMSSSTSSSAGTQQTIKSKDKDKYMVKEEEMRSRYREYNSGGSGGGGGSSGGNKSVGVGTQTTTTTTTTTTILQNDNMREPKATDISMRRRLSTPKASPLLLKRTSSDKNRKESPLAKPEKTSWFKSLDRRAKSKSKEKLNTSTATETSSLKRTKNSKHSTTPQTQQPTKNLRFFGDTDLDSNPPTISKGTTTNKSRPSLNSTLSRTQKYSQSAYNLDRIRGDSPQRQDYRHTLAAGTKTSTVSTGRHKSTSMHNLDKPGNDEVDFRKRRHYSRSRELDDISESGSETEDQQKRHNGGLMATRTLSRDRLDRTQRYDENTYRRSNDRPTSSTPNGGDTSSSTQHQPRRTQPYLMGPPKPARSAERRSMSYSRERDRFPAESSGTEGESSLHSQRSVVYLHATTVGAIPQPYHLRRRSISRDDLRSNKTQTKNPPIQPMTRTVSRSVSMLAPWKPKLISEGYEINYSQEQNKTMSTLPRKPLQNANTSSTLTRTSKKSEPLHSRSRRHDYSKDDQSSLRNSSTTSASKSALSANVRRKH